MLRSMTAFASAKGSHGRHSWTWELRSVNGKGLDLRLRVPDWVAGIETGLRARLGQALGRGNVTLTLKIQSEDGGGTLTLNREQLDSVLSALAAVEADASVRGLSLAPSTAADVLATRGVLETGIAEEDAEHIAGVLMKDFEGPLAAFLNMRESEGAALAKVLLGHLDEIARLTDAAEVAADDRRDEIAENLRTSLARVMESAEVDEARVAQELALIAVKIDVTEEIDRLRAHVAAARDLLAQGSPVGRKFDFLAQEFNREANTLCSKAQNAGLTAIGLELKTAIDQMREQVQNVE